MAGKGIVTQPVGVFSAGVVFSLLCFVQFRTASCSFVLLAALTTVCVSLVCSLALRFRLTLLPLLLLFAFAYSI